MVGSSHLSKHIDTLVALVSEKESERMQLQPVGNHQDNLEKGQGLPFFRLSGAQNKDPVSAGRVKVEMLRRATQQHTTLTAPRHRVHLRQSESQKRSQGLGGDMRTPDPGRSF
jgi:hypothetical protein